MDKHEKLPLRNPGVTPTSELLERTLGGSYAAYEAFQDALPGLEIEQEWPRYTPPSTANPMTAASSTWE